MSNYKNVLTFKLVFLTTNIDTYMYRGAKVSLRSFILYIKNINPLYME